MRTSPSCRITCSKRLARSRWQGHGRHHRLVPTAGNDVVERNAIRADDVRRLRFVGGDAGGRFESLTGETYQVGDAVESATRPGLFEWDPGWALVAVRDPETGERVLIDGNERASQIHLGVADGTVPPDLQIRLLVGELAPSVIRIAKAFSSLWHN